MENPLQQNVAALINYKKDIIACPKIAYLSLEV